METVFFLLCILIMCYPCSDGVGRTGTFICIHAQLERLKTEGVVDFFQSIKSARIQRAELVPDVVSVMVSPTDRSLPMVVLLLTGYYRVWEKFLG
jgi:hypothetical protein